MSTVQVGELFGWRQFGSDLRYRERKKVGFCGIVGFLRYRNAPPGEVAWGGVLDFIRNAGFDVVAVVGGLLYDLAEGA